MKTIGKIPNERSSINIKIHASVGAPYLVEVLTGKLMFWFGDGTCIGKVGQMWYVNPKTYDDWVGEDDNFMNELVDSYCLIHSWEIIVEP